MGGGSVTFATMDEVRALLASWMPRRAGKDNKEGHRHAGGEVLQAEATVDLTLSTTAQSFTGTGDSSAVRLLLSAGTWKVTGTFDFDCTVAGDIAMIGELFVYDSASAEGEQAVKRSYSTTDRATVSQSWRSQSRRTTPPSNSRPASLRRWGRRW